MSSELHHTFFNACDIIFYAMSNEGSGKNADLEALRLYIERTGLIRKLSSPQVKDISGADSYRATLLGNFTHIGELARLNGDLLEKHYFPLMRRDTPLDAHRIETLRTFSSELIDATRRDNLDLPMLYEQAARLLDDAVEKKDDGDYIRALDQMVIASYAMMYVTLRLKPYSDESERYRKTGMDAGRKLTEYLAPDRFLDLPDDECRELVLINSRYMDCLLELNDSFGDHAANEAEMDILRCSLALADDPFYREAAPGYDWTYHVFRALEYFSALPEFNNRKGFDKTQLLEIREHNRHLLAFWEEHEEALSPYVGRRDLQLASLRVNYLCGDMDVEAYKTALMKLTRQHKKNDFSMESNMIALLVSLEYVLVLDPAHLSKTDERNLNRFYRELIGHMHHIPKARSLSFVLTYLIMILETFIETPDGMRFETFCLDLMAALHPPTYVHTLSVASIAKCLAKHLLRKEPRLFTGVLGYETEEAVTEHASEIEDFVYHSAICHDFGKLAIIETILTYGRKLIPSEIAEIRTHPEIGAGLLKRFDGTKGYADAALGHHRWYDNSGGYPESFDMVHSPLRTVIALIAGADCLDASTDAVGRSYKEGKALDRFLSEVHAESGTRYAPFLAELIAAPAVRKDVELLLAKGRDNAYHRAYRILERHDTV